MRVRKATEPVPGQLHRALRGLFAGTAVERGSGFGELEPGEVGGGAEEGVAGRCVE